MAQKRKWIWLGTRILGIAFLSFIATTFFTQQVQTQSSRRTFQLSKPKPRSDLVPVPTQPMVLNDSAEDEIEAAARNVFEGPADRSSFKLLLDYLWKEEDHCTLLVLLENFFRYPNQDLLLQKLDLSISKEAHEFRTILKKNVPFSDKYSHEKAIAELENLAKRTDNAYLYFVLAELSAMSQYNIKRTEEYLHKAFQAKNLQFYPSEVFSALEESLEKGPLHYLTILHLTSYGLDNPYFLLHTLWPIANWRERLNPENTKRALYIASLAEKEAERLRKMPLFLSESDTLQTFANGLRALFLNPTLQFEINSHYRFYDAFKPVEGKANPERTLLEEEKRYFYQSTQNLVQDRFEHCQDEEFLSRYWEWKRQRLGKARNPR